MIHGGAVTTKLRRRSQPRPETLLSIPCWALALVCAGCASPSDRPETQGPARGAGEVAGVDPGAPVDPASSSPPSSENASASHVLTIAQRIFGLRPEILDWWWNNIGDTDRFRQWHPTEHVSFAWLSPPRAAGDLGAEVGASYRSEEIVGGVPTRLVVRYVGDGETDLPITLGHHLAAKIEIDGSFALDWVVQYEADGDQLVVRQQVGLPAGRVLANEAALCGHLEQRMIYLGEFLRDLFVREYVGKELLSRGRTSVTAVGLDYQIVVEQRIGKLTVPMVDWWWDNIDTTERYRRWHPTDHVSFAWQTPPTQPDDLSYDVGASQQVQEKIGSVDSHLLITWADPAKIPIQPTHERFLYGRTYLAGTPFGGYLVHEYSADGPTGILMKSTFRIPIVVGTTFATALGGHCQQEMQFLQYFLPALFAREHG